MMPEADKTVEKRNSPTGRIVSLLLKVLVTGLCFWYISSKIDFGDLGHTLQKANVACLVAALFLYFLSKILASVRLNVYFRNIGLHLPQKANFRLYLLGLFYNLFLPGSIGGDAYKVVLLKRRLNAPYRKTSLAVLIDRFSGLLGLGLVLCFFGVSVLTNRWWALSLPVGFAAALAGSYFAIRNWVPEFLPGFWPTFFWGLAVQGLANASALFLLFSLGIYQNINAYMTIFLVASVAAMLPLTLGGLGAREIVFYQLSAAFGLAVHDSVLIGLLFYFLTVITSAMGLPYVFIDPLKSLENKR